MEAPHRNSFHSSASESSIHDALSKRASIKSKPHDYFAKGRKEMTKEEKDQIACTNRLSNLKSNRRRLINDYELPVSDRESWWRSTIKETPSPLKYNMSTFTKDLIHKPNTYRFKSDGRKRDPMPQVGRGEYLLPGAYNYDDFAKKIRHLNLSYGFKNVEVHNLLMDRNNENPDLGPFTYPIENYLTISNSKEPSKHSFFKSKQRREIFVPKEGPSPGEYEDKLKKESPEITSVFKSKSGRFKQQKQFRTPGPGEYEPISAWINSKQSEEFNTKGQFFTPSAKVVT